MITLSLRTHPPVIFAYTPNSIDVILRVENTTATMCWAEADILLPATLSLGPDTHLRKGRLRLGILEKDHSAEKNVRIYANNYTKPQMYRCKVILFTYDRDGVIMSRLEKTTDILCEMKKAPVL